MQEVQSPTPEQIRVAQEKSRQRMQATMAQAKAQDADDDEEEDDAEADHRAGEGAEEANSIEIENALTVIEKSPQALARLKRLLGIKEDVFAVTHCTCPECVYEGEPGSKFYRATRQYHWFCYVCGGGPYVWQLTQPPYIKPISRHGVIGESHYCCGSACQSRYESRYGLHKSVEYVAEGTYTNAITGVVAR